MMSEYTVLVEWQRSGAAFIDNKYSRAHTWSFDGGVRVPASSSPSVVPLPYSDPAGVDPEEVFVASLSSCHMLWFLSLAAKRKYVVEAYQDDAVGTMAKLADGRYAMTQVRLRPRIVFGGDKQPSAEELNALHDEAHHLCFIANSVKTEMLIERVEA